MTGTVMDLDLAGAVIDLGRLALAFGRIDRTACYHPDGQLRESDSDHTVMLGWIAPALADKLYPGVLDPGLVAQFALVHDMPEVYAGDTSTLRITDEGRQANGLGFSVPTASGVDEPFAGSWSGRDHGQVGPGPCGCCWSCYPGSIIPECVN